MARGSRGGGPAPCSPASRRSPPGPRGRPPPSEGRARCPQVSGPWWGSRGVCVGGGSGLLPRSRSRLAWAHVAAAAPPEDARASEGTLPPSPATTSAAVLGGARRGAARYGRGMAAEAVSAPPTPPPPSTLRAWGRGRRRAVAAIPLPGLARCCYSLRPFVGWPAAASCRPWTGFRCELALLPSTLGGVAGAGGPWRKVLIGVGAGAPRPSFERRGSTPPRIRKLFSFKFRMAFPRRNYAKQD